MPSIIDAPATPSRWAAANDEFRAFAAAHPECLTRAAFAEVSADPRLAWYDLQSWPLFIDPARRKEMADTAVGMDRLLKGAIERIFAASPAAVAEHFSANDADAEGMRTFAPDAGTLAMLADEPNGVRAAPSRADYIEDAEGLKCVEYNAGGFLGGMQLEAMAERYLAAEPIARFLAEHGLKARAPGTTRALMRHMLRETIRMRLWTGGPFHVAVIGEPSYPTLLALHDQERYQRELLAVLEAAGIKAGGRVWVCADRDVKEAGGKLTVDGHVIHCILEHHDGRGDTRIPFRYFKMGRVNFMTGPIGWLMNDKRNLALVSERAQTDDFTAAERDLIRAHVPWTRRVTPSAHTFRGRTLRIPNDLPDMREHLVLKKASSIGGRAVSVGRFCTASEWNAAIARALHERDWVVQEYLQTVPYLFQHGDEGAVPHDLVWGLFAFGSDFGGAFLRMMPAGGGKGVVNAHQGAQSGVLLELVD
jgi:hypothetical protein